jgi:hypothetical protein
MHMPIVSLRTTNVGPFDKVGFQFDPHVNVLVGPNNSGKTTVLLVLADLLVDDFSMPQKIIHGTARFSMQFEGVEGKKYEISGAHPIESDVGKWTNRSISQLQKKVGPLGYRAFVPALRVSTGYRSKGPQVHFEEELKDRIFTSGRSEPELEKDSSWVRDDKIIQQIVELDYRAYRENKPGVRELINLVAELASEITEGFKVEFAGIGEDSKGLFPQFKTPDGVVPLDVLSQGTQSLIQWAAKLVVGYAEFYGYPKSLTDKPGILIIDEIDAHLHPSWQRRILRAVNRRFPGLQVICAAHSPLTMAGLRVGQVQLLRRGPQGKIRVSRNESDIVGWSADEIYSSFFDVEPTDFETDRRLARVRTLRSKRKLDVPEERELRMLRNELKHGLLSNTLERQARELATRLRRAAAAKR